MLDEFCSKLSDKAQLAIALRLVRLALPVWAEHFARNPDAIEKVNALLGSKNTVEGGGAITAAFPEKALGKIERSFDKAAGEPLPIVAMKKDPVLWSPLATCTQPLTNPEWDAALPNPASCYMGEGRMMKPRFLRVVTTFLNCRASCYWFIWRPGQSSKSDFSEGGAGQPDQWRGLHSAGGG